MKNQTKRKTPNLTQKVLIQLQSMSTPTKLIDIRVPDLMNHQPDWTRDPVGKAMRALEHWKLVTARELPKAGVRGSPGNSYRLTKRGFTYPAEYLLDPRKVQRQIESRTPELRVKFWRMLRNKPVLTVADAIDTLVDIGEATKHTWQYLTEYAQALEMAGYLSVRPKDAASPIRERQYSLIKDTGEAAPVIPRGEKVIIDSNTLDFFEWE